MRCATLLLAVAAVLQSAGSIALHIRVFDGAEDVTSQARLAVFKGGDRQSPIPAANGVYTVASGSYDVQVIREQEGKVTGIRWAEGLVVQPYREEAGQHLEVINLQSGYGALEVRGKGSRAPDAGLFAKGAHDKEVAHRIDGDGYALFVVPAGVYDLRLTGAGETSWHPGIEVPADRTRFVLASESK